uniref:Uncharacterized protein n=1 Tax=Arion vulgaris TaxID=1028688 RepID=A0A0B7AMV6_9EUPU
MYLLYLLPNLRNKCLESLCQSVLREIDHITYHVTLFKEEYGSNTASTRDALG